MPSKTKTTATADQAAQLQIRAELLDQLVTGPMTAGEVQGLFEQFKKAILERALAEEMSHHLGYAVGQRQSPQRQKRQDGAHRCRGSAHRRATRPPIHVRAPAHSHARAALYGL